jgi:hypothetical protein
LAASSASMKATLASVAASTAQSMACSSLRSVAEPGAGIPRLAAVVKIGLPWRPGYRLGRPVDGLVGGVGWAGRDAVEGGIWKIVDRGLSKASGQGPIGL